MHCSRYQWPQHSASLPKRSSTAATSIEKRDYRLTGPECKQAEQKGLVSAEWYLCPISRARLKELMRRRERPGHPRHSLVVRAVGGQRCGGPCTWGTWWCVPCFAVYGILYASVSDSRWHECGHGTAFKTPWMNEVVYQIASFMVLREATPWRRSHTRHHTDTLIVGCDKEIAVQRPPGVLEVCLKFCAIRAMIREYTKIVVHCFGRLVPEDQQYIPRGGIPRRYTARHESMPSFTWRLSPARSPRGASCR